MLLAIDTATRWTGLALHDGAAIVVEYGWYSANKQTVEAAPALADLLRRAQITAGELAAIAVVIGPGSYTGLRIGVGLAKGMALAQGTPLIGVPTLDVLAVSVPQLPGELVVVAEAGRTRVCAGFYRWQPATAVEKRRKGRKGVEGWQISRQPIIESWPDLVDITSEASFFTGEITPDAARLIRAAGKKLQLLSPAVGVRRAGYLAEIGWQRLREGQLDDAALLAPVYLRDPGGA